MKPLIFFRFLFNLFLSLVNIVSFNRLLNPVPVLTCAAKTEIPFFVLLPPPVLPPLPQPLLDASMAVTDVVLLPRNSNNALITSGMSLYSFLFYFCFLLFLFSSLFLTFFFVQVHSKLCTLNHLPRLWPMLLKTGRECVHLFKF